MWEGECYVFDNRVSVDHQLNKGHYDLCHACRRPITDEDKEHADYEAGVSCHHCINEYTAEQQERFRQREQQMQLARERGLDHLGADLNDIRDQRRKEKLAYKEAQRKRSGKD